MTQLENSRLEKVEEKMNEFLEQQIEMKQVQREILHALKGDELSVSKGLVPEFIALKAEVKELRQFKFYQTAVWFAVIAIVTFFKEKILSMF